MIQNGKAIFLLAALIVGAFFSFIGMPAGWLLGALLTGIIFGLFIKEYQFSDNAFRVVLALVGTSIGLLMERALFSQLAQYFFPLMLTLLLTVVGGAVLGLLLFRWTDLDQRTAFFCTIPGGASEVIAISKEFGADERIVAGFHTARISMFVLLIPFGIAMIYGQGESEVFGEVTMLPGIGQLFFFIFVICLAYYLDKLWPLPGGILIYSIGLAFIFSEFVFSVGEVPGYIAGIGQALIGALVGIRFQRSTLIRLRSIGVSSLKILGLFLILSLCIAWIFFMLTPLPYVTSLLSTVPAGAPEMASTAFALNLEPTLVASLHIIRLMVILLILPFLFKWMMKKTKAPHKKQGE